MIGSATRFEQQILQTSRMNIIKFSLMYELYEGKRYKYIMWPVAVLRKKKVARMNLMQNKNTEKEKRRDGGETHLIQNSNLPK